LGNFGVLLRGGYKVKKALFFNFLTALTSVIGAILALVLAATVNGFLVFLIPFAAGEFIYISVADLIPELHKEVGPIKSMFQLIWFLLGVVVMILLLLIG
jgi:zinc and cadmium transporter